jgi:hypothetical protein
LSETGIRRRKEDENAHRLVEMAARRCPSAAPFLHQKLQKYRGPETRAKRSKVHDESVKGEGAGAMPGTELATTSATAQNLPTRKD